MPAVVVGEGLECLAVLAEVEASGAVVAHVALSVAVVRDLVPLALPGLPLFLQRGCLGHDQWPEVLVKEPSSGVDLQERVDYLLEPRAHGGAVGFPRRTYYSQ